MIRDLQKELLGLQQEVHALRRQSVPLGRQEPTVALPSMPAPTVRREPASPAYELASKLVRKGASSEELMDTCGLSRGEVDLITMLNRMGQDAKDRGLAASA